MSERHVMLAGLLLGMMTLIGCHREGPTPGTTVSGRGVVSESGELVAILDRSLQRKFSFEGIQQRRVDGDRLEVIVPIRNRTNYNQSVDISTIFRDEANVPLRDESAWTRVIFGPNQTQVYRIISIDSRAHSFTVRVREGM